MEPFFPLSEYFGTAFHSYEGILLPGPHSLTFPPPSVCEHCFVSVITELKPVECQHLAHMFISSESVINFSWFEVNETVCVCVCVCVCVYGYAQEHCVYGFLNDCLIIFLAFIMKGPCFVWLFTNRIFA